MPLLLVIKRSVAWLSLSIENICAALWPVIALAFVYIGTAMIVTLPLWVYGLWILLSLYLIRRGIKNYQLVTSKQLDKTLEQRSDINGRPLQTLDDTPATTPNDFQNALWQAHQEKQQQKINALKIIPPSIRLEKTDPNALRIATILIFIIGLVIAGQQAPHKLTQALWPFTTDFSSTVLTVTPPTYTNEPALSFRGFEQETPIEIIAGSKITINHPHRFFTPKLLIDDRKIPFKNNIEQDLSQPIHELGLETLPFISQQWGIIYKPDTPPHIAQNGDVTNSSIGALEIPVKLSDDFGIQKVSFSFDLSDIIIDRPLFGHEHHQETIINTTKEETVETSLKYDVTRHLWSGLPVTLNLYATDAAAQTSETLTIQTTLPERRFTDERAQILIAARKRLAWQGKAAYKEIDENIAALLTEEAIKTFPPTLYLSAKTLSERISNEDNDVFAVIELLWDIALEFEDEGLTRELQALKDAIQALQKGIQQQQTDDVIADQFGELSKRLDEYVEKYRDQMKKKSQEKLGDKAPQDIDDLMLSQEDFDSFMEELLRDLQKQEHDGAQDKLGRLEDFLNNILPDLNDELPPEIDFSMKGINEIDRLIDAQEQLLESTKPLAIGENTQGKASEQDALRLILGQLIAEAAEMLDKIPQGLGLAELEMRVSNLDLKQNNPPASVPHQEKAIEYLREGQDELEQEMQQQLAQMLNPLGEEQDGDGSDPLGRKKSNGGEDGKTNPLNDRTVKIPNEAEQKRLREILDILRERAGEYDRPEEELDYIRKLLEKF